MQPLAKDDRFKLRIDPHLKAKLESEAQQTKKSVTELINKAIDHWFKYGKVEPVASMKLILLRYPATCKKCSQDLDAGSWALWGRGFGAICVDCYIRRIGDKTLITKELKVRQLKYLKKSLEDEIDALFGKYNKFSAYHEIDKTMKLMEETKGIIMNYLKEGVATDQEKTILEEVLKFVNDRKLRLQDIADWLMRPKKRKKKIKYEV